MSKQYIVVRKAGYLWPSSFSKDPKLGVPSSHSMHHSAMGKEMGVKDSYGDINEALRDVGRLCRADPRGNYAVCPLVP